MHPDTAHSGGPNRSYEIRKMVYFRLKIKSENDLPPSQRKNKIKKDLEIILSENIDDNDNSCKNGENNEIKLRVELPHIEKEYEKKNNNYPIFEDWQSVCEAHSADMWADLLGVKTLG